VSNSNNANFSLEHNTLQSEINLSTLLSLFERTLVTATKFIEFHCDLLICLCQTVRQTGIG